MYTKCPKCQTTFGITVDQLEARDGAVRCGRCMEVFNARWNLVDTMTPAEPSLDIPAVAASPAKPAPTAPAIDASPPPGPSAEKKIITQVKVPVKTPLTAPAPPPVRVDLAATTAPDAQHRTDAPGDESSQQGDAWNTAPAAADENSGTTGSASLEGFEFTEQISRSFGSAEDADGNAVGTNSSAEEQVSPKTPGIMAKAEQPTESKLRHQRQQTTDVMAPEDLLAAFGRGKIERGPRMRELEIDPGIGNNRATDNTPDNDLAVSEPGPGDASQKAKADDSAPRQDMATAPDLASGKAATVAKVDKKGADDTPPVINRTQFEGLKAPDPALASAVATRRIPNSVWFIGSALLLALIVVQGRWFYLDDLAQSPTGRPFAQSLCALTACDVPPVKLTHQFRRLATDIRYHPDAPAALRISTRIQNLATMDQPYPDVQLTLTDKNGKVVGRRTFQPRHYLGRRYNSAEQLTPRSVTRIDLDLMAPHKDAIGFEVDLVHRISSTPRSGS